MPVAKTSVIATGTTVRTKVAPVGLFDQSCYDSYFSCMDQFCITDNTNGGACGCSDDNATYMAQLAAIDKQNQNANELRTVEVEKIQAGAKADIVFGGDRQYDSAGNVITQQKKDATASQSAAKNSQAAALALFNATLDSTDNADLFNTDDIGTKTGSALYGAASDLCRTRLPDSCAKDLALLTPLYTAQIKNDCAAFANAVKKLQVTADQTLATAQKDVRDARLASLNAANKFDRGTCLINFKNCMKGPDVCGSDWSRCAQYVAAENAQINARSTAGTRIISTQKFDISASTQEMLNSKRNMCESVLDQCVAVRDQVWPDFIRDIAPELHVAELSLESNYRQTCMDTISKCAIASCNTDFGGAGKSQPMEACLARPQILRAACKVQIDPCERMEPQIWKYVLDKLAAMRVDACTTEVKSCFTDPGRCGSDFSNCIGMDYNTLHDMCPVDSLVVCKAGRADFKLSDVDSMLMGFWLNVDNSELTVCQNQVNTVMSQICGSTTDCNKFTADDTMGTGSLNSTKIGGVYTITGMISFGMLRVGVGNKATDINGNKIANDAGMIDLTNYFTALGQRGVPPDFGRVVDNIYYELSNLQGSINNVITMIGQDPKISMCINGRDMSQVTGKNEKTVARFPNLLNQVKMTIALSAIRAAQDNYNKKFNQIMSEAAKNASADQAELMCNKLPFTNGTALGTKPTDFTDSTVSVPYAIAIQIPGVSDAALAAGGTHASNTLGKTISDTSSGMAAGASADSNMSGAVLGVGMGASILGAGSTVASTLVKNSVQTALGNAGTALSGLGGSVLNLAPTAMIADAAVKAIGVLGTSKQHVEFDGGTTDMYSVFNRDTRNCHFCTHTILKDCETKGSRGFLGLWDSRGVKCKEDDKGEQCQDIPM